MSNNPQPQAQAQVQEPEILKQIKKQCHVVYGTEDGKKLIELMKEYYLIMLPTCPPIDQAGREMPSGYGHYREGFNECIRAMERFHVQYREKMKQKSDAANKGV